VSHALIRNSEGKYGFVDEQGAFLKFDLKENYPFTKAYDFKNGFAQVMIFNKWINIDTEGYVYNNESVKKTVEHVFALRLNNKYPREM